ncbi:MAG: Glu/Leu/Phe/Val dehydrogenase dimerization domain-containing protein [Gemmatimonadota bacterium]
MSASVWSRYGAYLETPPAQVLEWHDSESEARGWLVINSLRGGAAGGGTRMRKGVTREEVTYLAKAMQLKFTYSGPPIGGGKSGIDFDPNDPRRQDVLRRWYAAARPFLISCYGTGGDVNVDEVKDVVPLCAEMGIVHPQEGVVRGHLGLKGTDVERAFRHLLEGLRQPAGPDYGVAGVDLNVSDLITGYGVARAAKRLHERRGETLEGVRVVVEGFGNVGAAAALYLAHMGARIVGIVDAVSGLASREGLDAEGVEDLLRRRTGRTLPAHPERVMGDARELAYRGQADLFVPAAISGSVDARRLAQLARHGVRRMVCGANQPIREVRLGDTENIRAADAEFEVLPEIVASMGAARAFYHLMSSPEPRTAQQVFQDVGDAMVQSVDAVLDRVSGERQGLTAAALAIAMERSIDP